MTKFSGSQFTRDNRTGRPLKVRGNFELPVSDVSEDSVKAFLFANADELELDMRAEELKKVQDVETPTGRVVRYIQTKNGIPILNSEIQVRLDHSQKVQQIDLMPAPSIRIVPATKGEREALSPESAIRAARDSIGEHALRKEIGAPEQVYFPTPEGLHLAYDVTVLTKDPAHDWRIIVDAYSGKILLKEDEIWEDDGKGMVFDPNPVVTANDNTFRDPSATIATCGFNGTPQATIDAQSFSRTLNSITLSGGKYKLEGPFVKLRDFGAPNIAPPEETEPAFNYQSNNDGFEAVMVYFHVDTIQRYIQNTLGITNANNRQIEADAHDNGNGGGGFYSPGDKGLHFGDSGDCQPDRAEDADCIYHEYNHAIMDNMKPGYGQSGIPNPVTGLMESRALGEGFSDILACVYLAPDHQFQREVFEDWVFAPGGLRRVDGNKIYPDDWVDDEHDDGEIWSAALWNIYCNIGGDSASTTIQRRARDELLRTMILVYFNLTTNPNMIDAAQAMIDENIALPEYCGLCHKVMWDAFRRRGFWSEFTPQGNVDVYIDDGRNGGYLYQDIFWESPDIWNRHHPDGVPGHETPCMNIVNNVYVRIKNQGSETAQNVVVRGFNCRQSPDLVWPDSWNPMITPELSPPGNTLNPGAEVVVGPFKWIPKSGQESLLMYVSADGDMSNLDPASTLPCFNGPTLSELLVRFDNNIGQRNVMSQTSDGKSYTKDLLN